MCGIAGGFTGGAELEAMLDAMRHRGPDGRGEWYEGRARLGHVRLSIIDPTPTSSQPFERGDLVLTFNGEIWNYRELRVDLERAGESFRSSGDTEVVAALLGIHGRAALPMLQGMFALAWTADGGETVTVARDRHGEVPLHVARSSSGGGVFSSELKALRAARIWPSAWNWLPPGTVAEITAEGVGRPEAWYRVPPGTLDIDIDRAAPMVRSAVEHGAAERAVADVPVCVLLSGGIDSAVSAWTLSREVPGITAFTAWHDPKSADLRAAREVADLLGINLVKVRVEAPTADDLAEVVRAIEIPSKAQVEIGWHCLALGRAMSEAGFKVTVSGEGSDELWASYGFCWRGIADLGWRNYRERLFREQHRKNFSRCNKAFMRASVECRLPFLSTGLVELALSLPQDAVRQRGRPKAVLEMAFEDVLPTSITRRSKLAFQDGTGIKDACGRAVSDPAAFYRAEHFKQFAGGIK